MSLNTDRYKSINAEGTDEREGSGSNISKSENYILRLMLAKCDKGTMKNHLNIEKDHGILAMGDQQPILNANDHTEKNVIHFGDCTSEDNTEKRFRKGVFKVLGGVTGMILGEILEDIGVMGVKCKPQTPVPWTDCNDRNCLDGAPALTLKSQLACKNGGIISLVPLEEYPEDESSDVPEEEEVPSESPMDTVHKNINNSLESALEKVQNVSEISEETIGNVEAALAISAAMPPNQANHNMEVSNEENDVNNNGKSNINSGAIAVYSAMKVLEDNDDSININDISSELKLYGESNTSVGSFQNGVANYLNKQGYETRVMIGDENIERESKNAGVGILLTATTKEVKHLTYKPSIKESKVSYDFYDDGLENKFTFKTIGDLNRETTKGKVIGKVAVLVNKK